MSAFRNISDLFFRSLEKNLSKPEYLSGNAEQRFSRTDLNIVFTDVRPEGARQKAKSFLSIIDRFLEQGLAVSVIVHINQAQAKAVHTLYREIFSSFENQSNFRIVVATFKSTPVRTLWLAVLAMAVFFWRNPKKSNVSSDLAITISSLASRNWQFRRLFDDFTTAAWLGLTGGIELPALTARRDQCRSDTLVSALQFGQVSEEQYHFEGYSVDRLFVYDDHSQRVMASRVASNCKVVVSGSPEFEYELLRLASVKPKPFSGRLEILFIDQPIRQRSEYSDAFLKSLENSLLRLSGSSSVKLAIKAHPRGSAFSGLPPELYFTGDIVKLLPRAHIVVTCFSNLADLSVLAGKATIYVGASKVLGEGKLAWIEKSGGTALELPEDLEAAVLNIQQQLSVSPELNRGPRQSSKSTASQIILSELSGSHVT